MEYRIDSTHDGRSLSDYLRFHLRLSHKGISRLKRLENGMVLNGVRVTVRAILHTGDLLSLALEDQESAENVLPIELPLDILYEDAHLIALNKPPFMPTHPSHKHFDDTLANGLAHYFRQKGESFVFRTLNRLDRDTSGVVLVSKDKQTAGLLSAQMAAGGIQKRYLALLCGVIEPPSGRIDAYIRRVADSIITRETVDGPLPGAKPAITEYTRLACCEKYSLVSASPLTGRTHQLRVHFASLGHPILGDSLYGSADPAIPRQALHAASLKLTHPYSGETVVIEAPLPPDIQSICEENRLCLPAKTTTIS